ncbi:MAG: hypothetical protein ACOCRK_09095 [bacterium]
MVEIISTTATAAEASAIATTTAEASVELSEGVKEISYLNEIKELNKLNELKEASEITNNFRKNIFENSSFKNLKKLKEDFDAGGGRKIHAFQNLEYESNTKGQLGECFYKSKIDNMGNVETQKPYNNRENIIDLFLETDGGVNKFKSLSISEDGNIVTKNIYIIDKENISFEVKNGSYNSVMQELNKGHLQRQIRAGKEIADRSFLVTNEDLQREIISNNNIDFVRKINENGGEVLIDTLPSYDEQTRLFREV